MLSGVILSDSCVIFQLDTIVSTAGVPGDFGCLRIWALGFLELGLQMVV